MSSSPSKVKILEIGNYPPPVCGWAIQTKLLVEEIRRRGHLCAVLNLNENHTKKSSEYDDVQNIFDYVYKVFRYGLQGYRFQMHVNGQSRPGYVLALLAALIGRLTGHPIALSFRGGMQQRYFPRFEACIARWAFWLLFQSSGQISCNHAAVQQAIERYGIPSARVAAIPGFSAQHLDFQRVALDQGAEDFLKDHQPVFFCYLAFRPEYRLPSLREAMLRFRSHHPRAGFIWLGFPARELPAARDFVGGWPESERRNLLLLGNLNHDEFLTLMTRCDAVIRTPGCDGVSASVLESLSLGVPVIASQNGHRPPNVTTYREGDAADLCAKLLDVMSRYAEVKRQTQLLVSDDNIARTVDWLLREPAPPHKEEWRSGVAHAS